MGILGALNRSLGLRAFLEDRVLTGPALRFRPAFALEGNQETGARAAVGALRGTGGFLPGAPLGPERLTILQSALNDAYHGRRGDLKMSVNARTGIVQILNPLRVHPEMAILAAEPFLCGVVERYLRRRILLADVDVRRVPPMAMSELDRRAGTEGIGYTSSHWHRDIRGRQVKIMIYLSDVTENDSNFVFLPGTHKGYQTRPRRGDPRRVSDAWVESSGIRPVECCGAAGTVMVFDTNLVHRLRRKASAAARDSVTFYYTPGQELRALDVDRALIARLEEAQRSLFGGRRYTGGGGDSA